MASKDPAPTEAFWREAPFDFIRPENFEALGIDPADIPPGTYAAQKHPSQLPSRFGGNAYGFGFCELCARMDPKDFKLVQSIPFDRPGDIKPHYKEINRIYKSLGLLIRFSSLGKPYYLIPVHLLTSSLTYIKNKADEISKIIDFHRKKYLKESHKIALLTHSDDLIVNELSLRFKEHQFILIDSLEKLRFVKETLDLLILTRDMYEIILTEKFRPIANKQLSKKQLEKYVLYMLGKVYQVLKPDGEIFIIANHYASKTNKTVEISFKTEGEEKNFILFTHIFKTKRRYQPRGKSLQINIFDFQKYLSSLYVEQEVLDELLEGRNPETMTLEEISNLPYLDFPLQHELAYDQEKQWPKILSIYFNQVFLKVMVPKSVKVDWKKRFSTDGYSPAYMRIYLGQKKPPETRLSDIKKDIMVTKLAGCPLPLLADYRDSFDYLIRTLNALNRIKTGRYPAIPETFIERLRQPLENRKRRYSGLNDILKLMSKLNLLENIRSNLNPDLIEGTGTKVLKNLEIIQFYGLSHGELKEIFLIVVGHTAMGRVLSGKMHEKRLKPVSDMARSLEPQQAPNLLWYCCLMSVAEMMASKKADLNQEQLAEVFDIYESMVRVVTNRALDWERLLDEKISAMGGIHNKIIRRILKMMNHFQFLDNWSELRHKGEMEKESLSDYNDHKLARIENVIRLAKTIEQFESMFLKDDPLQMPIFCRKFLDMEFHGTGRIFEIMDSQLVFILLWITVNVAKGEVINFNPILAHVEPSEIETSIKKIEEEAGAINIKYLDLETLKDFSEQLYENFSAYIVGAGFQLRLDRQTQALEITYIDIDQNFEKLETLAEKLTGSKISEIPVEELEALEKFFANLESFYQSHLRLLARNGTGLKLPTRQIRWFKKAKSLREYIQSNFVKGIFHPEGVYSDLDLLYHHAPSLLRFILPEFMALQDLELTGMIYLKSSHIDYILSCAKKIQALIRRNRESFQNSKLLYKLAQREFGPMAAGTVGVSESQIAQLEDITERLSQNSQLFDAVIKSSIFQEIGRIPALRGKYKDQINRADHAQAGCLFLEKEEILQRYTADKGGHARLLFFVKYHDFLHHIIRGEYSLYAIKEILHPQNRDLLDAFFLNSFIMLTALREDLILEDLATWLFQLRTLSHQILRSETTLEEYFEDFFVRKGRLFHALEEYHLKGLPKKTAPARYLESWEGRELEGEGYIESGKMIFAVERIFRLRGIRYVDFVDLANLIMKVPLRFIYQKKKFSSIGYATFERELFEALRTYNGLQRLPEVIRHFVLRNLINDDVRLFGYENVSAYLNYENQVKLLLTALLGAQKFKKDQSPVCLDFLGMAGQIEKRYEAINDVLSHIPTDKIWSDKYQVNHFFKAKTGLLLKKYKPHKVLSIDFADRINISQKISHMRTIADIEQLKNYYHYGLRSLRKTPFYTDDYELQLERAFEKRLVEITDLMLEQAKKQMELPKDLREIHSLFTDLMSRSYEIGFTDEQRHRLNDLYEFRKDHLKREKLDEINSLLGTIHDVQELKDYWDSIKWYLLHNRPFLGKGFENLIAKKFDEAMEEIRDT